MDNKTLRRVQEQLLLILKEYKRVCDELHLEYFLDSGTLLGAVRHKGFIPWDDDIDVGMLRRDYEVFINKAPEVLAESFFLQTWHSDGGYGLAFAKLRMRNTTYIEESAQKSTAENGFYIDIFPYDVYPDKEEDRKWQRRRYDIYRRAIMVKCGYTPWIMNASGIKLIVKYFLYIPIRLFSAMNTREKLIRYYEKMSTKYNNTKTGFLYEQAGAANYGKWVIPSQCFESFISLQFEDECFSCPKDYDTYLKSVYGDYMILPPEDKRENRHRIIKIEFPNESTVEAD